MRFRKQTQDHRPFSRHADLTSSACASCILMKSVRSAFSFWLPRDLCQSHSLILKANELDQQPFEAQPPPEESIPRPMDPSSSCAGEEDAGHEHQEVFDPYKPLDMYDSGSHKRRPFRRMRIRPQPSIDDCVHQDLQARVFRIPPAAVNGCTYPEFNYALEALRCDAAAFPVNTDVSPRNSRKFNGHNPVSQVVGSDTRKAGEETKCIQQEANSLFHSV